MQNGIYQVVFSSNMGASGGGLAVVKDGSVNGGDEGYVYKGNLLADGSSVSGRLEIKRYNAQRASVFGPLTEFQLDLVGAADAVGGFSVSGGLVGQPGLNIKITGRFITPAA